MRCWRVCSHVRYMTSVHIKCRLKDWTLSNKQIMNIYLFKWRRVWHPWPVRHNQSFLASNCILLFLFSLLVSISLSYYHHTTTTTIDAAVTTSVTTTITIATTVVESCSNAAVVHLPLSSVDPLQQGTCPTPYSDLCLTENILSFLNKLLQFGRGKGGASEISRASFWRQL